MSNPVPDWTPPASEKKLISPLIFGGVFLAITALVFGFLGRERLDYVRDFYPARFKIDFLEGTQIGMKVRYQGALEVGHVKKIEVIGREYFIVADLRRNFRIPKVGSRITLQTWGFFGAKFINIDVLSSARSGETYPDNSIIPMQPALNMSQAFVDANDFLRSRQQGNRDIENQILELRNLSRRIARIEMLRPTNVRSSIHKLSEEINNSVILLNDLAGNSYSTIAYLDSFGKDTIDRYKKQIPAMLNEVKAMEAQIKYGGDGKAARLFHSETQYEDLLQTVIYVNRKLASFRESPHRIFFE